MNLNLLPAVLVVDDDAKIINSFFINPNIYEFNLLFFDYLIDFNAI